MGWHRKDGTDAITKKVGAKLLSAGYREWLGRLVPEQTRTDLGLPEGSTWADAIALQTVKRAVGLIKKDDICFTAITELRESTEGKTPEKVIAASNEELLALARAVSGAPAELPEGSPVTEDD